MRVPTDASAAPLAFHAVHTGQGVPAAATYLPADPDRVLWGSLPRGGDRAVLRIHPGQTVVVDTISHEGILADQGSNPGQYFDGHGVPPEQVLDDAVTLAARRHQAPGDGPHVITGPIAIDGAQPGDLLAVRIDDLQMRAPYGVISTRHHRGVLSTEPLNSVASQFCPVRHRDQQWFGAVPLDPNDRAEVTFPLDPFLGIMGVATDTTSRMNSVPPGLHGGNLDIKLLTTGATLYLPVQVLDALFYIGDPHYAQGNGEIALTALEAPLRATLTLDVIPGDTLAGALDRVHGPFAAAHGFIIPTGLHERLDQALQLCASNAVELIAALFDMDPRHAYLYLSAASDFAISQAVDLVRGVHGHIRIADFPPTARTSWISTILDPASTT